MSPDRPRFPMVDEQPVGPIATDFARAVFHRLSPRLAWLILGGVAASQVLSRVAFLGNRNFELGAGHWKNSLLGDVVIAVVLLLAVTVADEAVSRGAPRVRSYLLAVLAACSLSTALLYPLQAWLDWEKPLLLHGEPMPLEIAVTGPLMFLVNNTLYGMLVCFVYVNFGIARQAAERMHAAELARVQSRRRTLESQLQAMQARVEPQFLFNTLAQARELYDHDPALAGRMLDDLIAYLRAALPHLRESSSTLGQEVMLARAYLDIMRIRLGDRLDFRIEVPETETGARLPPMMLLPLIDHVLVHGLQPGSAGGTIRISTQAVDGKLRLSILDSGVAFIPGQSAEGLANIERRLDALYGSDAHLRLERAHDRGTRATLEIPYEPTDRRDRGG